LDIFFLSVLFFRYCVEIRPHVLWTLYETRVCSVSARRFVSSVDLNAELRLRGICGLRYLNIGQGWEPLHRLKKDFLPLGANIITVVATSSTYRKLKKKKDIVQWQTAGANLFAARQSRWITIRRSVVCVCTEIKIYLCKCEQSPVGFMDVCGKTRKLKRMWMSSRMIGCFLLPVHTRLRLRFCERVRLYLYKKVMQLTCPQL